MNLPAKRPALRDEISAEGLAVLRRKGQFGPLTNIFPAEAQTWATCVSDSWHAEADVGLARLAGGFQLDVNVNKLIDTYGLDVQGALGAPKMGVGFGAIVGIGPGRSLIYGFETLGETFDRVMQSLVPVLRLLGVDITGVSEDNPQGSLQTMDPVIITGQVPSADPTGWMRGMHYFQSLTALPRSPYAWRSLSSQFASWLGSDPVGDQARFAEMFYNDALTSKYAYR